MRLTRVEMTSGAYSPASASGGINSAVGFFEEPEYRIDLTGEALTVTHVESGRAAVFWVGRMKHGVLANAPVVVANSPQNHGNQQGKRR